MTGQDGKVVGVEVIMVFEFVFSPSFFFFFCFCFPSMWTTLSFWGVSSFSVTFSGVNTNFTKEEKDGILYSCGSLECVLLGGFSFQYQTKLKLFLCLLLCLRFSFCCFD